MATNVKFKRSAIGGKRPSISQLELGELALNTNDGRVFTRKYNVGIGSTVTLLNIWTENIGGGAYYTDGNIGIGTTLPTSALSVVGNGNFTGSITASSFNGGPLSGSSGNFSSLIVSGVTTSTGGFVGNLTGTATSTTNIPNLTGDVTSIGNATTLATVNSNVGTFGGIGAIPVVTVNGKGLVTGVSTVVTNIPNLTGDVTSIGNATAIAAGVIVDADINASAGIVDTKLATIATALKVSNSATTATNANTASAIVARDASGNFSAGTITASLTGTASRVTTNANLTGHVTSVGNAAVLGSFTSANLAAALTDETGSGANVFATSPTLVTPLLGTPTSGTLTNCTGLPVSTGISGLGANVATFLATPSSANLISAVTDETGTGALVFATSPTLVTPTLGAATATSVTASGAITANSYNVGTDVGISTTRTIVATTAATTIDSFAIATFRSARVQVQITQSTNYQTSDVLIIHNGTTADLVEYGSIATNDYLGTFSAIVSGGNCLLQINMSSATSSTVKVLSQRITI